MTATASARSVGSLRIRRQPESVELPGGTAPPGKGSEQPPSGDGPIGRLLKLIPGEAMMTYTAGRGVAKEWLPMMLVLSLILLLALRYTATRGPDGKPQWVAVLASAGAFAIWVITLGDPLFGWPAPWPLPISLGIAMAYVAIVGIFYKGD